MKKYLILVFLSTTIAALHAAERIVQLDNNSGGRATLSVFNDDGIRVAGPFSNSSGEVFRFVVPRPGHYVAKMNIQGSPLTNEEIEAYTADVVQAAALGLPNPHPEYQPGADTFSETRNIDLNVPE
ncbi:MAG TPA: hypothetical protein VFF04_02230 [Candidatus Babeliales bacterium]|nr:hypothetical protein [Candidatus Babeliales bacterium]